jgi:phosphate transport system substrate-binding protein
MNKITRQKSIAKAINYFLSLLLMLMLADCTHSSDDESARSGTLTVIVDHQLEGAAAMQKELFSRYYPDARISLMPVVSAKSIMYLLERKAGAALINGGLQGSEDSLVSSLKLPLRREAVGHDAIVCIVNKSNPIRSLSLDELTMLYTGQQKAAVPLVTRDDYRLLTIFADKTGKKRGDLHAWASGSDVELISRVASDKNAVGLLFRSSLKTAQNSLLEQDQVKIVALGKGSAHESSCLPTPQNIFDGSYPLATTVYYVYYSGNALAAGFGSWLGSNGQKGFERSSLVPVRLLERTIILK